MRLLREYIRELLTEAAKGPKDLIAADTYIKVKVSDEDVFITYADRFGTSNTYPSRGEPVGEITMAPASEFVRHPIGPCDGAYSIEYSEAMDGWGPMLYDVAIEVATQLGGGLTPDRSEVSSAAERVWDYYLSNRSDVNHHQLDVTDRDIRFSKVPVQKLTPEIEEDDCTQKNPIRKYGLKWHESALSKRYTKAPTTINALRAAGRLIEQ